MNFLVSYDLNKSGKNYDGVFQAIKDASTGKWCRPLKSVWVIQSNLSAQAVYETIAPHLDSDDRILVIEVTSKSWWYLDQEVSDYLKGLL